MSDLKQDFIKEVHAAARSRYAVCVVVAYSAIGCCEDFAPHHYEHVYDSLDGTRDAARRHDALARRKYVKPFKWFKFNRARRATAK